MKWVLIAIIKLYWIVIPENKKRTCLFKETCSRYVYRHTVEHGFFKGMRALVQRAKKCRKGYQLYTGENGFEIKLADGSIICENEISPIILKPISNAVDSYIFNP
jgi:uncharacterized protein